MSELQVTFTAEERQYLLALLETTLKDTRVEEHRTRTPSYLEHVLHQEELIVLVMDKLRHPPGSGNPCAGGPAGARALPPGFPRGVRLREGPGGCQRQHGGGVRRVVVR